MRGQVLRILFEEQRQRRRRLFGAARATPGVDQPQHRRLVERQAGGAGINGRGLGIAARGGERIAERELGGRRAGALRDQHARLGDGARGVAGGELAADHLDQRMRVAGIACRRGAQRADGVVAGEAAGAVGGAAGRAVEQLPGGQAVAACFIGAGGERQRIGVGVAALDRGAQPVERASGIARAQHRGAEQAADDQIGGLCLGEPAPRAGRALIPASLEIGATVEQHRPRRGGERAAGMVEHRAGEARFARACGEHGLQIQRLRMARPGGERRAGGVEQVEVAPQLTQRRGIADQRGRVISIALQRRLEPGQCGGEAVAGANHLRLQGQRAGIAGGEPHRARRRLRGAGEFAGIEADAAEVHHRQRVIGVRGDPVGQQARALTGIAAECGGARARADRVAIVRRGLVGAVERALRIALQQPRLRLQAGERRGRFAELTGARQCALRRSALAQPQIAAREQQHRGA